VCIICVETYMLSHCQSLIGVQSSNKVCGYVTSHAASYTYIHVRYLYKQHMTSELGNMGGYGPVPSI